LIFRSQNFLLYLCIINSSLLLNLSWWQEVCCYGWQDFNVVTCQKKKKLTL
jgi:hypothetical protein